MNISDMSPSNKPSRDAGLLFSPFNAISINYGPPTIEAFGQLCEAMNSRLTNAQRESLRALGKYVVTEDELRPFGAMMPFFIADFFGLNRDVAAKAAHSWLSLYLWSVVIDKAMDGEDVASPADHMLYSQLLTYFLEQVGGANLSQSVKADIISDLSMAMRFQSYSVPNTALDGSATLPEIRAGKNLLFLAIGRLVCSPYAGDLRPLQALCERFSGVLQALDDLTDIRVDIGLGINTPIIAAMSLSGCASDLNDEYVLSRLVSSGALSKELEWAAGELQAIVSSCPNTTGHSYDFVCQLNDMICEILPFAHSGDIDGVRRRINVIYCNT